MIGDTSNYLALAVKPVDVATPLMQAAKIQQSQMEAQQTQIQMHRDAIGAEARGLAPLVGTPDYEAARQASTQRLGQMGILDTPQAQAGWARDSSSPLGIQSLLARTNPPQMALQEKSLAETTRHNQATEAQAGATLAQTANAPVVVPYGAGLANKKGEIIREPMASGILDKETLGAMADQYRAGDTSVLTNLGRGAQGAENIVALRREIARRNADGGQGGADQAMRNAEFFGVKSGARTVGVKGANIDLAATEFNQVLPTVVKASEAVNRTNYPVLNKIIQAAQEGTGDPNIVAFGGGLNTLVNIYARAISPQGVGTVADKEHAREILQKAWSQGQFNAAVGMMKQEIEAALNSPEKVREEQRKRFLSGQGGAAVATPAVPAQAPQSAAQGAQGGIVDWKTYFPGGQ